jgi:hypothetical protein
MSAWTAVHRMAKPPERLVHLVLESHDGTALVPIPERSTKRHRTLCSATLVDHARLSAPQIGLGEIDDFVSAAV